MFCNAATPRAEHESPSTMRSTTYPRTSRAVFCSALLLSQHAVVDANHWATGRASSSRSSKLAVMQPGGRNRPIRDWKAIKKESEEKLAKQSEEKALEKARQAGEFVEAVEDAVEEVVDDTMDRLGVETASADVLGLEEGTPESLGVTVAKVAVIASVGLYGAKKVVAFAKAVLKGRKEAPKDADAAAAESSAVEAASDDDEDQGGDETAAKVQADGGQEEDDAAAEEESDGDEVTDGFVTADEEEEEDDASQGAAAALGDKVEAAKGMATDMKKRAKSNLESFKAKAKAELGEAADRAEGDGDGDGDGDGEEGDLRARLPKGGKVDVSYV